MNTLQLSLSTTTLEVPFSSKILDSGTKMEGAGMEADGRRTRRGRAIGAFWYVGYERRKQGDLGKINVLT